jgi:uracil phosphoribosyltransferase
MKTKIGIILPLFIIVQLNWLFSQTAQPSPFYDNFLKNGWVFFTSFLVLGGFYALLNLMKVILKMQQIQIYKEIGKDAFEESETQPVSAIINRWYKKWTNVVPQEKEHEIMFNHQYDGIRELDNSLPPWWMAMFYVTILFAGVYMVYYHVADIGISSQEEYTMEIKEANAEVKSYLSTLANKVDENTVAMLDAAGIEAGKKVINAVEVCTRAVSLGTVDTLVSHPASMTHMSIPKEERIKYGITDGLIRMSVGIENIEDLEADLAQALAKASL